eukprot:gene43636-53364_t
MAVSIPAPKRASALSFLDSSDSNNAGIYPSRSTELDGSNNKLTADELRDSTEHLLLAEVTQKTTTPLNLWGEEDSSAGLGLGLGLGGDGAGTGGYSLFDPPNLPSTSSLLANLAPPALQYRSASSMGFYVDGGLNGGGISRALSTPLFSSFEDRGPYKNLFGNANANAHGSSGAGGHNLDFLGGLDVTQDAEWPRPLRLHPAFPLSPAQAPAQTSGLHAHTNNLQAPAKVLSPLGSILPSLTQPPTAPSTPLTPYSSYPYAHAQHTPGGHAQHNNPSMHHAFHGARNSPPP